MFTNSRFEMNAKVYGNKNVLDKNLSPIYYHGTTCCAMGIMSAQDYHTLDELKYAVDDIRNHSLNNKFSTINRDGGERTILCVTTPHETALARNLSKLGFKNVGQMNRRVGYPAGKLTLHMLSF